MPAAPSLLIVPYRSKTGKLYSQIPTSGAGDFTVTRNTEARRFNSAGLIASVASGIPRLDYLTSGGTAGCPALLVEPAATNLAFQSANFLTTWVLLSGTISTGSTAAFTAPDGTTSADLFTESTDVSATNHQISQSISTAVVSGTSYTLSCFFKATAANRSARLSLSSALFSGSPQAFFDITSGIVGTTTDCTARIENYGSGWYRCIMTAICDAAGTASVFVSSASGNTRDYIGNGSASLYLWGAQLETGSVATSYIPTTAGTGSRSGDLVSVTGAVSGSIGQTAGTFYIDLSYSLRSTSTATRWFQVFGSSNNIGLAVATSNVVRSIVNGQSDILSTPSTSDGVKIAWGYDGSGVVCFVNGTQYTLTNGGAQIITQLNQISLDLSTTTNIGNCRLRAMALYTTRLTNAELAALTA
jgi:hypothetical protein